MIKPNAVMTAGPPCSKCGGPVKGYYVVQLCDSCLEDAIPERPCHVCGKMDKHHPRFTRYYDGSWKDGEGKPKPGRYFCAEHADQA